MTAPPPPSWLLLVHQLPPRPLYLRAKVRQRLVKVGAVALKNSVYALPDTEDAREDFTWIAQEARAGGGDAFVAVADFMEGLSSKDLVERFRQARDVEYEEVIALLRAGTGSAKGGRSEADRASVLARAAKRFAEIRAIDFFEGTHRREVEAMLHSRERANRRDNPPARVARAAVRLRGRVWVTRRGVKVDRLASAWLIRRFVDPSARFRFVDPSTEAPRPRELRFDMAGGEYTHEGDRCTFETLVLKTSLADPALAAVAEIVHDIDLKDGKYSRPETAGVRLLVEGIVAGHTGDDDRLARGLALFDDLYASLRQPAPRRKARKRRS